MSSFDTVALTQKVGCSLLHTGGSGSSAKTVTVLYRTTSTGCGGLWRFWPARDRMSRLISVSCLTRAKQYPPDLSTSCFPCFPSARCVKLCTYMAHMAARYHRKGWGAQATHLFIRAPHFCILDSAPSTLAHWPITGRPPLCVSFDICHSWSLPRLIMLSRACLRCISKKRRVSNLQLLIPSPHLTNSVTTTAQYAARVANWTKYASIHLHNNAGACAYYQASACNPALNTRPQRSRRRSIQKGCTEGATVRERSLVHSWRPRGRRRRAPCSGRCTFTSTVVFKVTAHLAHATQNTRPLPDAPTVALDRKERSDWWAAYPLQACADVPSFLVGCQEIQDIHSGISHSGAFQCSRDASQPSTISPAARPSSARRGAPCLCGDQIKQPLC